MAGFGLLLASVQMAMPIRDGSNQVETKLGTRLTVDFLMCTLPNGS